MKDELDALSDQLRAFVPAPPPRELEQRVAADLLPAPKVRPFISHFRHPLAWAAAVVLTAGIWRFAPGKAPPTPAIAWESEPVVSTPVSVVDEGFSSAPDGRTIRRVRMKFEDTLRWRDPASGAQLLVSFPREEVLTSPARAF